MKERILIITACVLSCVVIFGSIIAYKEYKKANVDVEASQSTTYKAEENTSAEQETTAQINEETTLETEENKTEAPTSNRIPQKDKKPVHSTKPVEKTTQETITAEKVTEESTTEESTTEEVTTEESTTEETTTEKIYPVLAESKADMVRLINSLTTKASQGSYSLTRVCSVKKKFSASNIEKLNEIIQSVNPDATFNSAINDYLGVGTTKATITNGRPTTNIKKEYLLKATSLTEADVRTWQQRDNKIIVSLIDSYNYFTFEHVTNDFITVNTINDFMGKYTTGYQVNGAHTGYGPLSLEVTIDDGKLTNFKINHSVYIDAEFKSSNRIEGTCVTETTYSDIVYN